MFVFNGSIPESCRSPAAVSVAGGIFYSKNYEDGNRACVLADALEEAGCTDEKLLNLLRSKWYNKIPLYRIVCQVVGAEAAAAMKRLDEIAADVDVTYNQLMEAANRWIEYGDYTVQHGDETWRDTFPQYADEFWRLYEIITGRKEGKEDKDYWDRGNFFSCSC